MDSMNGITMPFLYVSFVDISIIPWAVDLLAVWKGCACCEQFQILPPGPQGPKPLSWQLDAPTGAFREHWYRGGGARTWYEEPEVSGQHMVQHQYHDTDQ